MDLLVSSTGREVEILTKTQVRYSGVLKSCEEDKETVTLAKAISHGTETRESPIRIPGRPQIYEFIVFKVSKIEKIKVNKKWAVVSGGSAEKSAVVAPDRGRRNILPAAPKLPKEKYDFQKHNQQLARSKEKEKEAKAAVASPYDPSFFYDSLT